MKKIVIIEDDLILRENILTFLKEEGFNSACAEDGQKGLELIRHVIPDLIICDISMPVMDGYEVLRNLQKEAITKTIPFIFLTAKTQRDEIRKGMLLGVDDYLTKPFNFDELLKTVNIRLSKQETIIRMNDENYRIMIENSLTGIFILQDEKFIYANMKFREISGWRMEDLININIMDIIRGKDCEINDNLIESIRQGKKILTEMCCVNKNGDIKFLELFGGPIRFNNDPSFIGTVVDVTERKNFEKKLNEHMLMTEESERKRFSQNLHDGLGPLLSGIKLYVNSIQNKSAGHPEILKLTHQLDELIILAINSTKEIANNLTPAILEDFGISKALKGFIEQINYTNKLVIYFSSNFHDKRINKIIEFALYRVITELINNTIKHADAKKARLDITFDNRYLQIAYEDDGQGFLTDKEQLSGMGMRNIESRIKSINGKLNISSKKDEGVKVYISVDLLELQIKYQ